MLPTTRPSSRRTVTSGSSIPAAAFASAALEVGVQLLARPRLDDAEPRPRPLVARRLPEPVLVRGRHRLEPHELAFERRRVQSTTHRVPEARGRMRMPIYEYACMECESHFDELVRTQEQAVECPECGAANVLRQLSTFAVAGSRRSRASAAAAAVAAAAPAAAASSSAAVLDSPPMSADARRVPRRDPRLHALPARRGADAGRLRLGRPERRPDVRRRGARLPRGPAGRPVRRPGGQAARHAARAGSASRARTSMSRTSSSALGTTRRCSLETVRGRGSAASFVRGIEETVISVDEDGQLVPRRVIGWHARPLGRPSRVPSYVSVGQERWSWTCRDSVNRRPSCSDRAWVRSG